MADPIYQDANNMFGGMVTTSAEGNNESFIGGLGDALIDFGTGFGRAFIQNKFSRDSTNAAIEQARLQAEVEKARILAESQPKTNYTPFIIAGVALLAVAVLTRK